MIQREFEVYYYLGRSHYVLEEYEKSIGALQEAVRMSPRHVQAMTALANAHFANKKYKEAEKYYKKSLDIDESSSVNWQYLGSALYFLGENEEALEAYEKSLEINPFNAEAQLALSMLKNK